MLMNLISSIKLRSVAYLLLNYQTHSRLIVILIACSILWDECNIVVGGRGGGWSLCSRFASQWYSHFLQMGQGRISNLFFKVRKITIFVSVGRNSFRSGQEKWRKPSWCQWQTHRSSSTYCKGQKIDLWIPMVLKRIAHSEVVNVTVKIY